MARNWYENPNPNAVARSGTWRVMVYIVAFVVFFGAIGVGLWAFGVFTSDVKGRGDATKIKNSGTNRIAAQERFEDMYADVLAADRRIDAQFNALKLDPDSSVAKINYNGAVNYCIEVVADYNAEARKYTAEQFRSTDLPAQIDDLDSTTDCKESQ